VIKFLIALTLATNYFNCMLHISSTGLFALYVVVSERLHVTSTRCNHCWTWHQTILL